MGILYSGLLMGVWGGRMLSEMYLVMAWAWKLLERMM